MAGKSGNWEDNFSKIIDLRLAVDGNKEWKFTLEEHKTKGTMQMNVRQWNNGSGKEGEYIGPNKNGFIVQIKTSEDIDKLEKAFADYFKKIKEML
jgi:hypothetical protein